MGYIEKGSKEFKKANIALFAGGFSTFAVLYSTQPLLPYLSRDFHISPASASLSLSTTTISLAVSLLIVGSLSEAWGRKVIMTFSMFSASILAILTGFAPSFHILLALRILQGFVLSGLSAIAMAYLGEEIEEKSLGMAMGMFISGNSLGGMFGRITIGIITDLFNWRAALCGVGVLSLIASILFVVELPKSKHFNPRVLDTRKLLKSMLNHLKNPSLLCLYGIGFLLLGSLVSLYNYIGFQLIAPPYSLSPSIVGFIFILYLMGTFSSTWMGQMADKHSKHKLLLSALIVMFAGAAVTLSTSLVIKIVGIALLTFGFFGGHSIASSWVGHLASHDKAQASSLYLFFYYVGSSIGGTAGGTFWSSFGWSGVVTMIMCFIILALLLTTKLSPKKSRKEYI
ncbi:MFS transporter [Clostridium sp. YIM B02515]|uniref:MFS transporter n=1 Tax=Clostridium rhizosphaerae TaxID=2803861 RepID=A0ABS1T6U1_9CLOT|nr:MFS transporter [Clostridium rhizosphaerae]MBL4934842.1 MFS transporter [Clostridium rhizosphaerae]